MSKHFVPLKKKTTSSQEIKTYTLEVKIMRRRERDRVRERERENGRVGEGAVHTGEKATKES